MLPMKQNKCEFQSRYGYKYQSSNKINPLFRFIALGMKIHPSYSSQNMDNDIALIRRSFNTWGFYFWFS